VDAGIGSLGNDFEHPCSAEASLFTQLLNRNRVVELDGFRRTFSERYSINFGGMEDDQKERHFSRNRETKKRGLLMGK